MTKTLFNSLKNGIYAVNLYASKSLQKQTQSIIFTFGCATAEKKQVNLMSLLKTQLLLFLIFVRKTNDMFCNPATKLKKIGLGPILA